MKHTARARNKDNQELTGYSLVNEQSSTEIPEGPEAYLYHIFFRLDSRAAP